MQPKAQGREARRVGLLVLGAVVVLAAGIFLIGERNNLFQRKNRYFVEFQGVSGLKPGNPVQLNGVDVGTVEQVILPEDPNNEFIRVWISVDRSYAGRIRAPAAPVRKEAKPQSVARIKTLGLLGDKYVEITSGSPEYPVIPSDGQIPSATPTNVDALLASGEDVMDNVVEISASLSTILGRMERGEGLLGQLTSDTAEGQRMQESILGTFETVQRIAEKVESGDGPLPRLINDRAMADRLAASLDRFESILAKAEGGEGLLPGLLNDPGAKARFDDTLATLNQVAKDVQGLTADLESSEALLPRLLKDERYGREVTEEIRSIVDRLGTVSERLTSGEGTAGKLINDPQIYEAVNDVILGINESRILRWLIRNRQKAGIEKRYEDAKGELERQGQPVPPLPPASEPEAKETDETTPESNPTPPPPGS